MKIELEMSPVEVDAFRRLMNRLYERNGAPMDLVRARMIDKLRRAATAAEEWCEDRRKAVAAEETRRKART